MAKKKLRKHRYYSLQRHFDWLCRERGISNLGPMMPIVQAMGGLGEISKEQMWQWLERSYAEKHGYNPAEKDRAAALAAPVEPKKRATPHTQPIAVVKPTAPVGFYQSELWREVRFFALKQSDGCCALCGRSKRHHGVVLHVDHIKPRSKFPHLELTLSNLQVLCADCNLGKSNRDDTDWRTKA